MQDNGYHNKIKSIERQKMDCCGSNKPEDNDKERKTGGM